MIPAIKLGPLVLSSFGVLLLLALWLGGQLADRRAVRAGLPGGLPSSLTLALLGVGVVSARLWYVLFNLDLYRAQPQLAWQLSFSGLSYSGALLAGAALLWAFARLRPAPAASWSDLLVPALPWSQALGMLGLLLSGEAYGRASTLPWAVPLLGVSRHPTQIYEALALLALGLWLWRSARNDPPSGVLTARYLAGYGALRLLLEPLRGGSLLLAGSLRVEQVLGLALLLGSLYWLWWHAPLPPAQTASAEEPGVV